MKTLKFPRGRIGGETIELQVSDDCLLTQAKANTIVLTTRNYFNNRLQIWTHKYEVACNGHINQTGLYSLPALLYGRAYFGAYRSPQWLNNSIDFTREAFTSKTLQQVRGEMSIASPSTANLPPVSKTPQEMIDEIRRRSGKPADLQVQVGMPVVIKQEPTATTAFKEIFAQLFGSQQR